MKRLLLLLALAGCTPAQVQTNLQANGVSAPVAQQVSGVLSTAVADGTLFCSMAGVVAAVPGVNVKGASAQTVANACATAQLVGAVVSAMPTLPVPVAPPAVAASVPVATVPPLAAAAVAQSVKS